MKSKTRKKKPRISKLAIQTAILLTLIILAYDLSGIGGNIKFYSKWIECGQKPVQPRVFYVGEVPNYSPSPTFSLMRLSSDYFCTPLEAEREGYSSVPDHYEFPHLDKAGEAWPSDI